MPFGIFAQKSVQIVISVRSIARYLGKSYYEEKIRVFGSPTVLLCACLCVLSALCVCTYVCGCLCVLTHRFEPFSILCTFGNVILLCVYSLCVSVCCCLVTKSLLADHRRGVTDSAVGREGGNNDLNS